MSLFESKLHISEHFSSIQGEGKTMGIPAVFWRFKGCPCSCVWCDTVEVWKKGTAYTFEEAYAMFAAAGYFSKLNRRSHHLVITGGDPILQAQKIAEFLVYCQERGEQAQDWYIECENQATLRAPASFTQWVRLWNISPKLSNSGMPLHKRYVPMLLDFYAKHTEAIFKFPISSEADLAEAQIIQRSHAIQASRMWLMPVCSSREQHNIEAPKVAALAEQHGYKFSARLQLVLWDATTGV